MYRKLKTCYLSEKKLAFEQGYAKALDDVDEVIANWQDIEVINGACINCIKRLSTQIAKLAKESK